MASCSTKIGSIPRGGSHTCFQSATIPSRMTKQDQFIATFTKWVESQPLILGAVLVGSHARGAARVDSDIDLVVIAKDPKVLLEDDEWLKHFGNPSKIGREDYQSVQSKRVFYTNGLEVEFGITTSDWLVVSNDTRQILNDGHKILNDKASLFSAFFRKP